MKGSRRAWVAAFALAAAAALAWGALRLVGGGDAAFARSGERDGRAPAAIGAATGDARSGDDGGAAFVAPSRVADERDDEPLSLEQALAAGVLTESVPLPADAKAASVKVLAPDTKEPVAGAIVAGLDVRRLPELEFGVAPQLGAKSWRAAAPFVARSDAAGIARLPSAGDGSSATLFWAEHAGRRALAFSLDLAAEHFPTILWLADPAAVQVRVVDEHGQPRGGIPVAAAGHGRAITRERDGIARFDGLELGELVRPDRESPIELPKWVTIAGVGLRVARRPVLLSDVNGAPIELVLPPSCELLLRVVDANGAIVPIGGTARIAAAPDSTDGVRRVPIELDPRGITRVPAVALGCEVDIGYDLLDRDRDTVVVRSPDEAGAVVTVDLPLPREQLVVAGRLVDERGAPVASRGVALAFLARSQPVRVLLDLQTTVGRDGELRVNVERSLAGDRPLRDRSGGGGVAAPVLLEAVDAIALQAGSGDAALAAEVEIPKGDKAARMRALGDIVVRPPPDPVRGRVVDETGAELAGAEVVALLERDARDTLFAPDVRGDFSTRSQDDGRFELRLPPSLRSRARLRATQRDDRSALSDELPLASVSGEILLVVRGDGAIEGSVVGPAGFVPSLVALWLRRIGEPGEGVASPGDPARARDAEAMRRPLVPHADGSFAWPRLRSGSWEVVARDAAARDADAPLATIGDVVVRTGETTRDERLDPLRLDVAMHEVALEIVDADGHAIERGTIAVVREQPPSAPPEAEHARNPALGIDDADHAPLASLDFRGGAARLVLPRFARVRLAVCAPGYAIATLQPRGERERVVLDRRRAVELRLSPRLLALRAFAPMQLQFTAAEPLAGVEAAIVEALPDVEGHASIVPPQPGRYFVRALFAERDEGGTRWHELADVDLSSPSLTTLELDWEPPK